MFAISTNALSLSDARGFEVINYPDGAVTMRLPQSKFGQKILLFNSIRTAGDLTKTLLAIDAIKRIYPNSKIVLHNLYNAFLRQDRVASYGDSCGAIFDGSFFGVYEVINFAAHNADEWYYPVNLFLDVLERAAVLTKNSVILGTDKSAVRRFGFTPDFYQEKVRDATTGKITGAHLQNTHGLVDDGVIQYLKNQQTYLILDDIFDGGGGFQLLLTAIESIDPQIVKKRVNIVVPHAVFSNAATLKLLFETYTDLHFWITDSYYLDDVTDLQYKVAPEHLKRVHIFPMADAIIGQNCSFYLQTNFHTL